MTADYIENNFSDILKFENVIEKRISCVVNKDDLIKDNQRNLLLCKKYGLNYILIDKVYSADIQL